MEDPVEYTEEQEDVFVALELLIPYMHPATEEVSRELESTEERFYICCIKH
jgi:hypothetical protein